MSIRNLVLIFASMTMLAMIGPLQAQQGPPDRLCVLLGMLGAPCDDRGDEQDAPELNSAGVAYVSHADVLSLLADDFFEVVPRSSSTLYRNATGLTGVLSLANQPANQATTLWWVIYNHPEYCATTPCTFDDFAIPEVEASFFTTGGRVSDRFGHVYLDGSVFAGTGRPGAEEYPDDGAGDGLTNPLGAEVNLASRTHGDADVLAGAGVLDAALSSLFVGGLLDENGNPVGCTFATDPAVDPSGCADPTIAFHLP